MIILSQLVITELMAQVHTMDASMSMVVEVECSSES